MTIKVDKHIISCILLCLFLLGTGDYVNAQDSPKKHIVQIKKMKFVPPEITVKKGDTVVWVNKDFFPHDVAKFEDKSWRSSPLQKGETWYKVITKSEDYYCTLHVVMKGRIVLKN